MSPFDSSLALLMEYLQLLLYEMYEFLHKIHVIIIRNLISQTRSIKLFPDENNNNY